MHSWTVSQQYSLSAQQLCSDLVSHPVPTLIEQSQMRNLFQTSTSAANAAASSSVAKLRPKAAPSSATKE